MDSGMVLRSALPLTPEAEDSLTHRSPSTITSVRLESRLRRSTWEEPAPMPPPSGGYPKLPEELNFWLSALPPVVSCCSRSPTLASPVFSI